jgi:hypothetical protein
MHGTSIEAQATIPLVAAIHIEIAAQVRMRRLERIRTLPFP